MPDRFFIDSSVMANYLLIKLLAIDEKIPNDRIKEEVFKEKITPGLKRAYSSYELIEKIKELKKPKMFFTSSLALSETISVVYDNYILSHMKKERIPIKYFFQYKEYIRMPSRYLSRVAKEAISFYLEIKNKITFTEDSFIQLVTELISKFKCDTHDSFLLGQAWRKKCNYFVTTDKRLKDKLKKRKKPKLIYPQEALNFLKK